MTERVSIGFLHPGEHKACFANSLHDLILHDLFGEQRIVSHPHGKMGKETGSGQIAAGRNRLAAAFLESDAEWLWLIDSDMGFAKDTVEQLVAVADPDTRPVVGGLAFALKSDGEGPFFARRYRATPTVYRMWETDDEVGFVPMFDYPRNQLVEVDATGAACLLVHRSVLQRVRDSYGDCWFDHIIVPKGKTGRTEFSEDLSFCLRLKACGVPVWVHSGVKTTHDKGGVFLDEDTYDQQQTLRRIMDVTSESIDVIVPTYGRADRLGAVSYNILDNSTLVRTVTFAVERDDQASIDAVAAIRAPQVRCVVNMGARSYAGAVNTAVRVVADRWVFTGADDLNFHRGWDVEALRLARATGAKVIGTNDLWNKAVLAGRHSTHSLVSTQYVRSIGGTADLIPGKLLHEYHHNFVDPELVQVAMHRGVYAHCHTSIVEHMHPLAGKADGDATYELGMSEWDADQAMFEERSKLWRT